MFCLLFFAHIQSLSWSRLAFQILAARYRVSLYKAGWLHQNGFSRSFFFYTKILDRRKYIYPLDYRLINKDSSICIAFSVRILQLADDSSAFLRAAFPGRTANTAYMLSIRHKADTISNKVNYYPDKKAKKKFSADKAGDYMMFDLEVPYEGKFNKCRVVFMHKQNLGDAEVYYFYVDDVKKRVDKLVKKTGRMIWFKN